MYLLLAVEYGSKREVETLTPSIDWVRLRYIPVSLLGGGLLLLSLAIQPGLLLAYLAGLVVCKTAVEAETALDTVIRTSDWTPSGGLTRPVRIALGGLGALRDGELCACELQVVLDAPQSTVASHLRELKGAGLVETRRQGKWTYYRIGGTAVLQLLDIADALRGETA